MKNSKKYIVTVDTTAHRMNDEQLASTLLDLFGTSAEALKIRLPEERSVGKWYQALAEAKRFQTVVSHADDGIWIGTSIQETDYDAWIENTVVRVYTDDCVNITGEVLNKML